MFVPLVETLATKNITIEVKSNTSGQTSLTSLPAPTLPDLNAVTASSQVASFLTQPTGETFSVPSSSIERISTGRGFVPILGMVLAGLLIST